MELNFLLLNDEIILWKSSFASNVQCLIEERILFVSQEDY